MIPLTFRHIGSRPFARKEISIDFQALPQIVAVEGPNWIGKSTLLDLIVCPYWVVLPYRPTALFHQFVTKGYVDATWSMPDSTTVFRSVIRVDPGARRTEADLSIVGGAHLAGPLVSAYKPAVEEIVGPLDTALASMYAVQRGDGSFLALPRPQRRAVFADLMGLKRFPPRHEHAKAESARVDKLLAGSRGQIEQLTLAAADKTKVTEALADVRRRLTEAQQRLTDTSAGHKQATEALAAVKAEKAGLLPLKPEAERLDREIKNLDEVLAGIARRLENNHGLVARRADIETAVEDEKRLTRERDGILPSEDRSAELEAEIEIMDAKLATLVGRIDDGRTLLARAAEIRAAAAQADAITLELHRLAPLAEQSSDLATEIANLVSRQTSVEQQCGDAAALLARAREIDAAVEQQAALDAEYSDLDTQIEAATTEYQAALHAHHSNQALRQTLTSQTAEKARLEAAVATLPGVPCGGEGKYAGCMFLKQAVAAKDDLPGVEAEIAVMTEVLGEHPPAPPVDRAPALRATRQALLTRRARTQILVDLLPQIEAARAREDELRRQVADLSTTIAARSDRLAAIQEAQADLPSLEKDPAHILAREAAALQIAEAVAPELAEQQDRLLGQLDAARSDFAQLRRDLDRLPGIEADLVKLAATTKYAVALQAAAERILELEDQQSAANNQHAEHRARLEDLRRRLERLAEVEEQITVIGRKAYEAEGRIKEAHGAVTKLERESGSAEEQIRSVEAAERELAKRQAQLQPLTNDLEDWALIGRAMGPTGIPALRIDEGLPEISQLSTTLLRECFGASLFGIKIVSQVTSADETKMLEALDVQITRDGETLDAGILSGGELALATEGISLAISIYQGRRSGRRYGMLLRDEVTAALTEENARGYVKLLRRAADIGRFQKILYVSHHRAALDLADAVLHIKDEAVTLT